MNKLFALAYLALATNLYCITHKLGLRKIRNYFAFHMGRGSAKANQNYVFRRGERILLASVRLWGVK